MSCSIGMYSDASRSYSAIPSAMVTSIDCRSATGSAVCIGPPQRAGEDGVDPLEGEVLGEVARLVLAGLGQLRVGRTLEALDPLRQRVPDEQQLHRLSC